MTFQVKQVCSAELFAVIYRKNQRGEEKTERIGFGTYYFSKGMDYWYEDFIMEPFDCFVLEFDFGETLRFFQVNGKIEVIKWEDSELVICK
jgi:hypothetical protein